MSLITKDNYEAYLLDYFEENLSQDKIAELMLFLEKNPQLKAELDDFEQLKLIPEESTFSEKKDLKRKEYLIDNTNYEDYLIAELENDNTIEAKEELLFFFKENPDKREELDIYKKTKLTPSIVIFNDKKILKKENRVIPLYWWYSSAAAVVLVLFFLTIGDNDRKEIVNVKERLELKTLSKPSNKKIKEGTKITKQTIDFEKNGVIAVKEKQESRYKKEKQIHKETKEQTKKQETIRNEMVLEGSLEELKKNENQEHLVADVNTVNDNKDMDTSIIDLKDSREEEQYADNVKIIFEDEVPKERKGLNAKQLLIQRFTKKFLKRERNEEGEVVAYAINLGKIGFSKKVRKKRKL